MNTTKTFFALMGATLLSAYALAGEQKTPDLVNYDVNGDETIAEGEQAYELKSADDLYWFMEYVNNNAVFDENAKVYLTKANAFLANNITVNNDLFSKLDEDGTVKSGEEVKEWFPIGYYIQTSYTDIYFGGTFDGNGHTISGLYFNNENQECVGLFGQINGGATIKNVGVIDSYIKGKNYVGGVCGYSYGTIENCYNTNTGKVSGGDGSYEIGGVCGYNWYIITNCYNSGEVSGGNESSEIGGVCGYNDGTIENCYNTGEVSGGVNSEYIGGVSGYNEGTIKNCYNTGKVSGGDEVGGVCGDNYEGTITNCYNASEVNGNGNNVGGVCGYNYEGTIENCYNTDEVSGGNYVGGVCGYNQDGTITNCYDFKLNSGTLSEYSIVVENNTIALPTEDMVSREGYQFGGWCTDEACEGEAIISEAEFNNVHTLYAKWIEGSTPTAIKAVEAESNKTIKTIKDGQIVIIRNGVMYDMQGRKL